MSKDIALTQRSLVALSETDTKENNMNSIISDRDCIYSVKSHDLEKLND